MSDTLQIVIVTVAAGMALLALLRPRSRKRASTTSAKSDVGCPTCGTCGDESPKH